MANRPASQQKRRFVLATDPLRPPQCLAGAVLVLGNFDGLHRGHRAVIAQAQALAATRCAPCAALTFEPHPSDYFKGPGTIFRLTPPAEKARLLDGIGLDGMIILTFDARMATMPAEVFAGEVLGHRLDARAAVAGYDFHFGQNRKGTPDYLVAAGKRHGYEVVIVPRVEAEGNGTSRLASSTAARAALERGDAAEAAAVLGQPYAITGTVLAGRRFEHTLGYPTANLFAESSCRLREGVYAVHALIGGCVFDAVARCRWQTEAGRGPVLGVYLLDFGGDLYGHRLQIDFIAYLRGEVKLETLEAKRVQWAKDVADARAALPARGRQNRNVLRNSSVS